MRINITRGLLLSALAIQTFCSEGSSTNVALDRSDQTSTQRAQQLAADSTHYLGDTSSTALALVIGKPVDGLSSIHKKLDVLASTTTFLQNQVQTLMPSAPYIPPSSDILSGVLLALRLTNIVDNMMNSAFSQTMIESGNYKFPASSGTTNYLTSNGLTPVSSTSGTYVANEYQIVAGADVASLFEPFAVKHACNVARLTPAQKLTIFLRAVFGIDNVAFSNITFPSTTYGCFLNAGSNQEDSGIVLMTIFDYVLGSNRNGTSGSGSTLTTVPNTINKFGGTAIFGSVNDSGKTNPTTYFSSITASETNPGSADIVRLRMLLNDLTRRTQ